MRDMAEEIPEANPPSKTKADDAAPIVARYDRYHRKKQYLLFLVLFCGGIYCLYDGFYKYPADNEAALHPKPTPQNPHPTPQNPPHGDLDAPLNKALGIILPPLGIYLLYRTLRGSRGEYRLEGQTLHMPGHPPIPLSAIRTIDKKLWDRKGIALIEYELTEGGERKKFRVDDVVYEREATDRIMDRIEAYAASVQQQSPQAQQP